MSDAARHIPWDSIPWEPLTDTLDRKLISGEHMMIAQVRLKKGCVVPMHSHENEQITYILDGALRFTLGEKGGSEREVIVRGGEVLHIPANVPHEAEALEDTLDVDVFSPPRADWLDGSDDYLRGGSAPSAPATGAQETAADSDDSDDEG